ncbi:MAG: PASTA domain-containing protein [Elusimicrobia bacterium]|nr:PASTA domain-containing protein [Elusimicrobiota bacterium]
MNEFFDEVSSKNKSKKGRPSKVIAFVLVTLILFAGLIYFSMDWALDALIHTRKEVTVPDLKYKTLPETLDLLAAGNLTLKKAGDEADAKAAPDTIVRQLPSAGTVVREGRVIRVWISKGEEEVTLPNLVGQSLRNAQLLIRQNGLVTGTVDNAYSNDYDKGTVSAQNPANGSKLVKGSVVTLVVSNGPPPQNVMLMPSFRMQKLTDISAWATANDINLNVTEDASSAFPNGVITDQSPAADMQVNKGDTVNVIVSRRPVSADEKSYRLHYEMAQGKNQSNVRITLVNSDGTEKDILNEMKDPGSKIDMDIPYGNSTAFRIYINGILVREREF